MTAALALLWASAACAQVPATGTWTLREAVREALENSPAVSAAAKRRDEAGLEEPVFLAELDPTFEAGFRHSSDRAPRAAPAFEGSRSKRDTWEAGLSQKTLLGTQARLLMRSDRLSNPTPFRQMDPTVDSRLGIELSQPLWRYFMGRPDVARRKRARAGFAAADQLWRQAREEAAERAALAFLEWRHARDVVGIQEAGVADAQALLAKYKEKRRYGLAEDSDLLQAGASLESQELQLTVARSRVESARHALLAALGGERVELKDPAREPPALQLPEAASEEEAVSARPELEAARRRRERAEWDYRVAKLDTLPELSLEASYAFAGLSGSYGRSLSDMGSLDHGVASIGASFAVPLGFKRERLTRKGAQLRFEAAKAEEAAAKSAALRQWRDAAEALRLARRRMEAGLRLFEIEKKKYAAEDAQFKRGKSSTDLLLRFQQDIRRAQAELLRAETDEALARVGLARARGRLASELAP